MMGGSHRVLTAGTLLLFALIPPAAPLSAQAPLPVHRWLVRGPIPADTGSAGLTRDYLGPTAGGAPLLPTVGDSVAGGPWLVAETDSLGRLDLNKIFAEGTDWSVAYAHAYVFAPEDRTVRLVLDSDDDLVARLNGQRVWLNQVARGLGRGSDTLTVRLAGGWNSLLLEVRNRTGGFGLLGLLEPAGDPGDLAGLRTTVERPAILTAFAYPAPTVTVGPAIMVGALAWDSAGLSGVLRLPVIAWGPEALSGVRLALHQGREGVVDREFDELAPGSPSILQLTLPFDRLRNAALGEAPIVARASWRGGAGRIPVPVGADALLRRAGGRIDIRWVSDSTEVGGRGRADLRVPDAFAGLSVDLLSRGLGPSARYIVNDGTAIWDDGRVELCAPCRPGEPLRLEIASQPGRPIWLDPQARIREPGYREYADGYAYAQTLTGRVPSIEPPDPSEWLGALGATDGRYRGLLDRYGAAYAPLAGEIRRDTLFLVGNSHIDAAWLWPWHETVDVIRDTWRTSLKLAAIFPGYVFAASAAAYYDAMDRLEPGLADSLRAAADAGDRSVVGGWWVEPDLNLPSGESLVRQGLYGQRYFERRYGRRVRVAWTPDSFGYPWTVPQILKEQGFDAFVTQKLRWNDSTEFPYDAFYWEGRDGSRIFTYNPYGYGHDLDPHRLVEERVEDRARTGGRDQIVLYGVGDHGGGPTIEMLERAEDLRRVPTFPTMVYADPHDALEAVKHEGPAEPFPVWRDELNLEYHRGTYTTQAWMKRRNRRSESMLQTAEALAALDTAAYPGDRLESAWHRVLFNQFHDLLPGSGIRQIYLDAMGSYDTAWATIDSVTSKAFADLRARMDTRGAGRAIVVFNPLGWPRSGPVRLSDEIGLRTTRASGRSVGRGGTPAMSPSIGGTSLWVDSVPALGARVIRLPRDTMSGAERRTPVPAAGPGWLENAYLRVEVDTTTGEIVRLYDKRNEREVLASGGRGNVLQIFDDRPAQWDAWNIVITGQRWEVNDVRRISFRADPRRATCEIERRWGGSTFRQTLVLDRASPIVDVVNDVDWHERRKLLKVAFALNVEADSATYEIPYGTIGRSGHPRTKAERAKFEVPGQRWADVSGPGYGVSLLNDSKYGWDYHGNVLRLSLLRAPLWPDSLADRGRHTFRFAVYPHAGDWRAAATERRAAEYNVPLVAREEPAHPGRLGRAFSFVSVRPDNVHVSWLKRAEDTDAFVLRLVEWHGQPAEARISLACPIHSAREADLLEDPGAVMPVDGRTVSVKMRPYEIATLLIECGEGR